MRIFFSMVLLTLMFVSGFARAMGASCGILIHDADQSLCFDNVMCALRMSTTKQETTSYFLISRAKRPVFKPIPIRPSTKLVEEKMRSLLGQPVCAFGYWNNSDILVDTIHVEMQSPDTQALPESRRLFFDAGPENDIDGPYDRVPGDSDHP